VWNFYLFFHLCHYYLCSFYLNTENVEVAMKISKPTVILYKILSVKLKLVGSN